VISFDVSEVAVTSCLVVLEVDLMLQSRLQSHQYLHNQKLSNLTAAKLHYINVGKGLPIKR
jgi:hypothetical protein